MLLLLLSPWPVWAESSTAAATSGTPGTLDCPEACARAPGGLVNCSGRALPAVPAGLSRGVRALLLDHNRVRALPPGAFVGAGTLLRLDLRENGLRWVHARAFWSLGALQQLDLSDNLLEALAPGTFSPLRALRSLSLAGNRLARLEPAALGALPLLRALSLRDNQLSALAPGLLAGLPALHALHLRGNPWTCGCALRQLCSWLRRHPRPAPGEAPGRPGEGGRRSRPQPAPSSDSAPVSRRGRDAALRVAGAPGAQPLDRLHGRRLQPLLAAPRPVGPGRGLRARARLLPRQPRRLPGAGLRAHRLPHAALPRGCSQPPETERPGPGVPPPPLLGPERALAVLESSPCPLPFFSVPEGVNKRHRNFCDIPLDITTAQTGSGAARARPLGGGAARGCARAARGRHALGTGRAGPVQVGGQG